MKNVVIKRLIKLAEDWREFGRDKQNEDCAYCNDAYFDNVIDKVRCYYADNSNHTSVRLDFIEIEFFSPVHITYRDSSKLTAVDTLALIRKYRSKLDIARAEYAKVSEEEIQKNKSDRIERLKKQLSELENERIT